MWAAGGLIGLEGAAKRRMLSLAERPSLPLGGAVEGIVAVCVCVGEAAVWFWVGEESQ